MIKQKQLSYSIILFLLAFGLLYWNTIYGMITDWYVDQNYSHGFLIPLVSGYLLWQRKDKLKSVPIKPMNIGLLIIITGFFVYLVGNVAGETFTMRVSMLVIIAGTILFACGIRLFNAVSFPFFYLIFMIPLPFILYDSLAFPLKLIVSKYSVDFMKLIGIPVLREGNIVYLVNTTLQVADACSGLRSIISLLALSTVLAYFVRMGLIKKVILVVFAIPIAVIGNSIRVIATGILSVKYGAGVAEGFYHEFAGIGVFGIAMGMLILTAIFLGKIRIKKTSRNLDNLL
jgi:exosortase